MSGDGGERVVSRPSGGVAAEQPGDCLFLGADVGAAVAGDVHERAEHVWMHDGQVDGAGAAHRPSGHTPVGAISADAEVRDHEWHDVFRQVIGGVTAGPVDALGVVVERAGRIDEDQHRGEAVVVCREVVDGVEGAAGAQPVRRGVEGGTDHHDGRQPRRRIAVEPRGRQIHQLLAVREVRRVGADCHGDHDALGRSGSRDLHCGDPQPIDLIRQGPRCQLIPCGNHRREIAHPAVQGQGCAQRAQGHRKYRQPASPPVGARPAEQQHRGSEPAHRYP